MSGFQTRGLCWRPGLIRDPTFPRLERRLVTCYIYIVHMDDIRFAWHELKARANKRKHGISFEEAETVFYDENAIEFHNADHFEDEDRFIMLGLSFRSRMLVVCHCVRESGNVIRIISARKATRRETETYWERQE
jgi:uncharacterized DUF497 family protein